MRPPHFRFAIHYQLWAIDRFNDKANHPIIMAVTKEEAVDFEFVVAQVSLAYYQTRRIYTSNTLQQKCSREKLVDGSVALLVLLEDLSHCKLEVFLSDMLSPFTKCVHAWSKINYKCNLQESNGRYTYQPLYIYRAPPHQNIDPSSQLEHGG